MKNKKCKSLVAAMLSVACLATTAVGVSLRTASADEAFDYPVKQESVSVATSNNGLIYSATDAIAVQTVAKTNRAEANYGWGAFAASDFVYGEEEETTSNALVVDISFPQNNFNYGLQIVAIDKEGNKANLHAGYGWGVDMENTAKKSFFRYYEEDSLVGTKGTIEEAPLRAWVFTGIQATEANKVQTAAQVTKTGFYGKYIFPTSNYASVDFNNLDQLIFMSAAANNNYGKWSVGNIYLGNMEVPETITSRPYITEETALSDLKTIWTPSAEKAVPYLPAALNGVDDGAFAVSYVKEGFTLSRSAAAMIGNYSALTAPFPADLGAEKVSLTDLAYYFEVNNTSEKDLEYTLRIQDSEDTTNLWYTVPLLENEELYKTEETASFVLNEALKQNMVASDGTITEGTLGVIPAGFHGKISVTLSEENFTAVKEEATFPEFVIPTLTVLFNNMMLSEGEAVNFKRGETLGFQSASAVEPPPPAISITDYDVKDFDLNGSNPVDEDATLFDFDGVSKGNYSFKVALDNPVSTKDTLGFLIQAYNPTDYNRPFNILFYDADGEVFKVSNSGDPIQIIDNKTNVTNPEIRGSSQIRFVKNLCGTVVIPWSSMQYLKTVGEDGASSTEMVNGKLNNVVAFSVEIFPDQAGALEVIWIVGDYGFVENDGTKTVFDCKYTDWTIAEAFEENKITLQSLPFCTLSYETNIDESVAALQIKLSAEKVYYPYGTAFINVIPNAGYTVKSVTLNGTPVEKSGATTYPVANITGGEAKFFITFEAIDDTKPDPQPGDDQPPQGGCNGTIIGVSVGAGALLLRKKRQTK